MRQRRWRSRCGTSLSRLANIRLGILPADGAGPARGSFAVFDHRAVVTDVHNGAVIAEGPAEARPYAEAFAALAGAAHFQAGARALLAGAEHEYLTASAR